MASRTKHHTSHHSGFPRAPGPPQGGLCPPNLRRWARIPGDYTECKYYRYISLLTVMPKARLVHQLSFRKKAVEEAYALPSTSQPAIGCSRVDAYVSMWRPIGAPSNTHNGPQNMQHLIQPPRRSCGRGSWHDWYGRKGLPQNQGTVFSLGLASCEQMQAPVGGSGRFFGCAGNPAVVLAVWAALPDLSETLLIRKWPGLIFKYLEGPLSFFCSTASNIHWDIGFVLLGV